MHTNEIIYPQTKCQQSCYLKKLYEQCKFVPYQYQRWIPQHWIAKHGKSYNRPANLKCFRKHKLRYQRQECPECAKSCQQTTHEFTTNILPYYKRSQNHITRIDFRFTSSMKISIQEYEKYTLVEMLSAIGGLLGLLTGCSVMSICELIFVIFLVLL